MRDSLLTIYPTAHKVEEQLKRRAVKGPLVGFRVTTLPQLTDALWQERLDSRHSLSPIGERLVLIEVVARVRTEGSGPISGGLVEHMLALIRRLKSAGIISGDWQHALESCSPEISDRLAEFATVFDHYEQTTIARGLADRHDRERAVLELLLHHEAKATRPRLLKGVERLLVAEIYDLSLLQFMLLAALIRIVGDAQVIIQAEPYPVNAARFAELTLNRFVSEESIADQALPEFARRGGRSGRLGFVLENIFAETAAASVPPDDGSIVVVEARNAYEEAAAVAQAIRRLLEREPLVALDRIAVLARDLTLYRDYLETVFKRYRIPLTIARAPGLRASMPVRSLIQILRLPLENHRRDALRAVAGGAFIQCRAADFQNLPGEVGYIDRETCPLQDCLARQRRVIEEQMDAASDQAARARMSRRLKFFEDGCAAWAEFQAALTPLEKPGTLREQLERLRQVLKTLRFDPAAGSMSDPEADSGSLWKILDGLATAATHTLVDEELSTRDFFRLVESALDEAEVDSATVAGGVRALTVAEARGLDFDYVFLLGLNDGVFPRADAENPLIPDDALPALNRALRASLRRRADLFAPSAPGSILRSRLERRSEEPFLFFLALSMPSRGVTLSYSRQDGAGGALAPSPYVGEVLRLLQDLPNPARQDSDAAIGDIFEERAFFSRVATEPGLIESTQALQRYRPRVESIRHRIEIERHRTNYLALPTREEVFRQRRASGEAGDSWITRATPSAFPEKQQLADSYNGRVDGDPLLRRMLLETNDARPRDWSASQLSDLASCGFRYFASRILRLDAPEDTDHEQTRLETGDLVHRLLKEVFAGGPDFSDLQTALQHARRVAERRRLDESRAARDPAFFELGWESILRMIEEVVRLESARHDAGDYPDQIETEFEFRTSLRLGSGNDRIELPLLGRIDRLELYERGGEIARLRVVDYKTSRSRERYDDLVKPGYFATFDLQMAVYLLAVVTTFRDRLSPHAAAEASYSVLRRREKTTATLQVDLALLDSMRTVAPPPPEPLPVAARIGGLIEEALAGQFDVDPLHCDAYCRYRAVCRYRERDDHGRSPD